MKVAGSCHRSRHTNGYGIGLDQPWTSSRCLRLLRPGLARFALLRRLASASPFGPNTESCPTPPKKRQPAPSEAPDRGHKRIRRTYSRRQGRKIGSNLPETLPATPTESPATTQRFHCLPKKAQASPPAGRVEISTPVLRKTMCSHLRGGGLGRSGQPQGCDGQRLVRAISVSLTDLQQLRKQIPPSPYRIFEMIFSWLEALLRSTEVRGSQVTKSLVAMCLRRLPDLLAEWVVKDKNISVLSDGDWSPYRPSASLDIYDELESLGATGCGWRPMRILVRAHGIALIQQAISDGLLDAGFATILAHECILFGAVQEGFKVLETLISAQHLPIPRSPRSTLAEHKGTQPLRLLLDMSQQDAHGYHVLSLLMGLFRQKRVPIEWITTKDFAPLWILAAQTMITRRAAGSGTEFVATAMDLLQRRISATSKVMSDSLEQTLGSMIATFAALAMTNISNQDGESEGRSTCIEARVRLALANAMASRDGRKHKQAGSDIHRHLLAVAMLIISARPGNPLGPLEKDLAETIESGWDRCWQRQECLQDSEHAQHSYSLKQSENPQRAQQNRQKIGDAAYQATIGLVCSIAHCCGRALSRPSHHFLQLTCERLAEGMRRYADRFHSDVAFALAQKTSDVRDLAYAEDLARKCAGATASHGGRTLFAGWQWESGISEWIVTSPQVIVARRTRPFAGPKLSSTGMGSRQAQTEVCQAWDSDFRRHGPDRKRRSERLSELMADEPSPGPVRMVSRMNNVQCNKNMVRFRYHHYRSAGLQRPRRPHAAATLAIGGTGRTKTKTKTLGQDDADELGW